jgi:hypothetical protein
MKRFTLGLLAVYGVLVPAALAQRPGRERRDNVVGTSTSISGNLANYRGLKLGMSLVAAAKQEGAQPSDARVVQQRPAIIQEMNWEVRLPVSPKPDPVKDELLSFVDGELFRIIVTYDRYKVEGMTVDDMAQSISATYGIASKPTAEIAYHSNYAEVAPVLARWEDSEYSCDLVRTGDQASFALVLYSKRLTALAQAAIVEAARLDAQEAPQRELDKQKKRDEAESVALDRARAVNKPNFRP